MKQSTFGDLSTLEKTLGPNALEGLHYAKKSDPEMLRAFKAISKIVRSVAKHLGEVGAVSATTTKRVDLTLTDETWSLLEAHAERIGGPVVWEIERCISEANLAERVESWKRADLERELSALEPEVAR